MTEKPTPKRRWFRFSLRSFFVTSIWGTAVIYCTVVLPLVAFLMLTAPSVVLIARFMRQGRVLAALIFTGLIVYLAFMLLVLPWLMNDVP